MLINRQPATGRWVGSRPKRKPSRSCQVLLVYKFLRLFDAVNRIRFFLLSTCVPLLSIGSVVSGMKESLKPSPPFLFVHPWSRARHKPISVQTVVHFCPDPPSELARTYALLRSLIVAFPRRYSPSGCHFRVHVVISPTWWISLVVDVIVTCPIGQHRPRWRYLRLSNLVKAHFVCQYRYCPIWSNLSSLMLSSFARIGKHPPYWRHRHSITLVISFLAESCEGVEQSPFRPLRFKGSLSAEVWNPLRSRYWSSAEAKVLLWSGLLSSPGGPLRS